LKHCPIKICFTPDEEIMRSMDKIDKEKLPEVCYTVDGSKMGELEIECFDAWRATIKFKGLNVHPGYAKNLMINAIHIACRFLSELPEAETPEHTEEREGFFHINKLKGTSEEAYAIIIIRDFKLKNNQRRTEYLRNLKKLYELRYPGLKIELDFLHQYKNMLKYLEKDKNLIDLAKKAIELAGLEVKLHSIRGGTNGTILSEKGIPTPNIFTGGELFHSRKEYIPTLALQKAAEVLIYLGYLWTQ
ncbi:MAG: tripeptide aminopeptidase PepT, partial [Promethearchaeota archaeon]